MNIIEAMADPQLFGNQFSDESWDGWRTLLSGFYGLENTNHELFHSLTNRATPVKPSKELWLVVGRRGGKSNVAALLAVYEAIFNNHESKLAPGEVATVMVIAADRKQARSVLRYIRGLLLENPMLAKLVVREGNESIELSNRCTIEITTASHRGIRGYSVAAAILDEVAFWYSDGANPDTEILSALRPALATLNGKLIALSSPYARKGVLWTNYKRYFGQVGNVLVAQAPTLVMNPKLDPEIVTEALTEDPISAGAEYLAQFRTDVEGYTTIEALDRCTRPGPIDLAPSRQHIAFVDPSGGGSDSFTLAICHMEKDLVVVDLIRSSPPPFSPEAVVDDFCKIIASYNLHSVYGDNYAGEWPKEQFRKRGISYKKSDRNRSELYRDLLPLINSERVQFPPSQKLATELLSLERRTSRSGKEQIDHPVGGHDDLANAVAGACTIAAKKSEGPFEIKISFVA